MLKLLQSNANDLRQILVFIWAKILALDKSCQADLVKDNGHVYFVNILTQPSIESQLRALAAFVLCATVDKYPGGQEACLQYKNLFQICTLQLTDEDAQTRKWVCLLLGKLVHSFDEAQEEAFRTGVHEQIAQLLLDDVAEVRAAAVYALSCFIGKPELQSEKSENRVHGELTVGHHLFKVIGDGSVLVRRELVFALATLINSYSDHLCPMLLLPMIEDDERGVCRMPAKNQEEQKPKDLKDRELGKRGYFVLDLCKIVLLLTHDPATEVARNAIQVNAYLKQTVRCALVANSFNVSACSF